MRFEDGSEHPKKSGKYYCRFDCDGTAIHQIAWWDAVLNGWYFRKYGTGIDSKCIGWFPLPPDPDGGSENE